MNGPTVGTKKPTLCRYFTASGSCYFGNDCQFIHVTPPNVSNNDMILRDLPTSILRQNDAPSNSVIDPLFQAFAPPTSLPPESKLQTYLNPQNQTNSNNLVDSSKYFLPQLSTNDVTTAMGSLNLDATRKTPNNTYASSRLTHSISSPSFSQYNIPQTNSSPFNQFGPSGDMGPNRICSLPMTGISPDQSPLISRKSPIGYPNASGGSPVEFVPAMFHESSVEGTTYYYNPEENSAPLQEDSTGFMLHDFDLYPGNPAHIEHMKPKANAPSFFLPDELRMDILHRHSLAMAHCNTEQNPDIPTEVDVYHNLCPLESTTTNKASLGGYISTVYKATNTKTGIHYCLRRVHNFRITNHKCMAILDVWKKIQHSNLVHLREAFTTKMFGDNSVVFVYDYHPGADTLMNQYFQNSGHINGYLPSLNVRQHAGLLPESLIWAYIVQLSSVLRTIHTAGLSCRTIEPSKILITGKSRLRLNCCGIFDLLNYDVNLTNPKQVLLHYQQEDLMMFGKVVLSLACNSLAAVQRPNHNFSMDLITRNYSSDLKNLILYLCASHRTRSINDIMPMIGARFYTQLDAAHLRSDVIELELAKEVQNGRMFRILTKLGTINERQEFNMDQAWSETGDRYPLKLFRDYLFHQVTEDGRPWLDFSHLVNSLNKLDAGSPEKICLMSRDEQNILIVSYAELKQFFEAAFNELLAGASKPS